MFCCCRTNSVLDFIFGISIVICREHRFQNLYGYFVGFLQSQDPDDGTLQALQEELNALDEHLGENVRVFRSRKNILFKMKIKVFHSSFVCNMS